MNEPKGRKDETMNEFPDDSNQVWEVPNEISKATSKVPTDWFGLILYATDGEKRISGNRNTRDASGSSEVVRIPVMPQTPARLIGALSSFPHVKVEPADFQDIVDQYAGSIGSYLQTIVQHYATLVSAYSRLCYEWRNPGKLPCIYPPGTPECCLISEKVDGVLPPKGYDFYQCFQIRPIIGTNYTVKDIVKKLFKAVCGLKKTASWLDFPNEWPPEQVNGEYKMISGGATITTSDEFEYRNVVATVRFVMDTQHYRIPRGFTLEVTGDKYPKYPKITDDPTDSSSSSSAYSSGASPLGEEVEL